MRALVLLCLVACVPPNTPVRRLPWATYAELGTFRQAAPPEFRDPPLPVPPGSDGLAEKRRATARDTAAVTGGVIRLGFALLRHFTTAIEFETAQVRSTSAAGSTTDSALHLGVVVVAGLTGRVGRLSLGAELAAGTRSIERHTDDFAWWYHQRDQFAEPRLRADLWVLPYLAIGVYSTPDAIGLRIGGTLAPYTWWR